MTFAECWKLFSCTASYGDNRPECDIRGMPVKVSVGVKWTLNIYRRLVCRVSYRNNRITVAMASGAGDYLGYAPVVVT
jgi:hypothetical protein